MNPLPTNKQEKGRKLIAIEWIDASISMSDQSLTRSEALGEKLIHGFAVGVLVSEEKDRYIISRDWFDEHDVYRGVASYPKTGIVRVVKYDLAEPKK